MFTGCCVMCALTLSGSIWMDFYLIVLIGNYLSLCRRSQGGDCVS